MGVLLVDDKKAESEALTLALENVKLTVEAVRDAKSAVFALDRKQTAPTVALVNFRLVGALAVLKRLRACNARVYVIALLDGSAPEDIGAAFAAGFDDVLRRPIVDEELVGRVAAPDRIRRWSSSSAVLDWSVANSVTRLRAFQGMGRLAALDLQQLLGVPLRLADACLARTRSGATIPMTLSNEKSEVTVSVLIDAPTAGPLAELALGDPQAPTEALEDVLREMANLAGGAFKRAALQENVSVTTGLPKTLGAAHRQSALALSWCIPLPKGGIVGIVVDVKVLATRRILARELREGMVLANDITNESGALFTPSGTCLTSTAIGRIVQLIGERASVEIAASAVA